mmetsp:Transcript_6669/g.14815  ORF Transcript_6669/g.14815 Transcript_6669/m.14815 type:complete len:711 (-) Transcript_6669:176-2308(-)
MDPPTSSSSSSYSKGSNPQQQQQQQQGIMQQLASASLNVAGNNNNSLQGANSVAAAAGMADMMGAVSNTFWSNTSSLSTSGVGNMGGIPISNGGSGDLNSLLNNLANIQTQQQQTAVAAATTQNIQNDDSDRASKRPYTLPPQNTKLPDSVASHLPLLQLNNPNGVILRSYYELSTNDILNLPAIPTEEEYCARLNISRNELPIYDQSALRAAQFSELALGALANSQIPLALELSNSSVMCLRNCVGDPPIHKICLYEVARAYLLHGIFRSFRGDSVRYFKYRRVCMTHILQMNNQPNVEFLLAAISFHDAWAYIMHNASEDSLPDIDDSLPRLDNKDVSAPSAGSSANSHASQIKAKYGCCIDPSSVATDPINQMWMQGSPPVFLNNEASLVSRSLDAFACAIRTCCDVANTQLADAAKATGGGLQAQGPSVTTTAVMANEEELCSRNIVMSAKSLLDQHYGMINGKMKKQGLYMIASVMSAFLENGEAEGAGGAPNGGSGDKVGGFTSGQIKNLLAACDIIIQQPLLLHAPGPIYHMASNAAILLCHLMNGIHADFLNGAGAGSTTSSDSDNKVKSILFDEVFDTFMAVRKSLTSHRKSLPVKLRCHGIPRPNGVGPFNKKKGNNPGTPFIDVGETLMCLCRGCQNFVLMGCSPCVAAERALKAAKANVDQHQPAQAKYFQSKRRMEADDLSLDDDALLHVLSRIVQN